MNGHPLKRGKSNYIAFFRNLLTTFQVYIHGAVGENIVIVGQKRYTVRK